MENQETQRNIVGIGSLVVVSVLLMALDGLGAFGFFRGFMERRLVPIEKIGGRVLGAVNSPGSMISFYKSGTKRITDLEARLAERMVEGEELNNLVRENERMRALLGVDLPPNWNFLPAAVLGKSADFMLIEAGKTQGLEDGMSVVNSAGVFLGKVVKVSTATSEVERVVSKRSKVAALIRSSGVTGLVRGQGNGLVLEGILQSEAVDSGDVVVSSGADQVLPGLLIGRVSQLAGNASDVYKEAVLVPAGGESNPEVVFVVVGIQ